MTTATLLWLAFGAGIVAAVAAAALVVLTSHEHNLGAGSHEDAP